MVGGRFELRNVVVTVGGVDLIEIEAETVSLQIVACLAIVPRFVGWFVVGSSVGVGVYMLQFLAWLRSRLWVETSNHAGEGKDQCISAVYG
jgi:hypothetical protein